MAVFENRVTSERVILRTHHTFGRRRTGTDTVLVSKDVSQIHASVRWEGAQWKIVDHSRNGTWLDGTRLVRGKTTPLAEGNVVRFGGAEQSSWKIVDLSPPANLLVSLESDEESIELKRFHVIPNEQNPEISLYLSEIGQWICESAKGVTRLHDGDIIRTQDKLWQFFTAGTIDSTPTLEAGDLKHFAMERVHFDFHVSPDEEHVFLKILRNNEVIDLGERAHHYLLLILARQRLEDGNKGSDPDSIGWLELEQLCHMLGLEPSHLNIQIFRARKQVEQALPEVPYLPQVIERRVGSVRFGYPYFQIFRGSAIEGQSVPENQ